MPQPRKQPPPVFMRLKETFRTTFGWQAVMTGVEFVEWANMNFRQSILIRPAHWNPLKEGRPVRKEVIVAFAVFCEEHFGGQRDWRPEAIAEPCERDDDSWGTRFPYIWAPGFGGWKGLVAYLTGANLPDEAFCHDDADLTLATRIIFRNAGCLHNRFVAGEAAEEFGQQIVKRTQAEYKDMLRMLCETNPETVLFATCREDGEIRRVALALQIPVTDRWYAEMKAGKVDDADLTPKDVLQRSPYLVIAGVSENRVDLDVRERRGPRSMALISTLIWQAARFVPPLDRQDALPHILTYAGTPEAEKRAIAYGFQPTGASTPLMGKAIYEFAPPKKERGIHYRIAVGQYGFMMTIFKMFQIAISETEENEG